MARRKKAAVQPGPVAQPKPEYYPGACYLCGMQTPRVVELVRRPVTENGVWEVRYAVKFCDGLTEKCYLCDACAEGKDPKRLVMRPVVEWERVKE